MLTDNRGNIDGSRRIAAVSTAAVQDCHDKAVADAVRKGGDATLRDFTALRAMLSSLGVDTSVARGRDARGTTAVGSLSTALSGTDSSSGDTASDDAEAQRQRLLEEFGKALSTFEGVLVSEAARRR
jgi:hypothetical protein